MQCRACFEMAASKLILFHRSSAKVALGIHTYQSSFLIIGYYGESKNCVQCRGKKNKGWIVMSIALGLASWYSSFHKACILLILEIKDIFGTFFSCFHVHMCSSCMICDVINEHLF